jgi:hypothetical protein
MNKRPTFETRRIVLRGAEQQERALALLQHVPLDSDSPLEMVVREEVKPRKKSQNDLMWSGPLADIAAQAWVNGRQFSDVTWHEHFKRLYLPEDFDAELCKEGYRKWDYTPHGDKVLVGSTTQLTVKGFAQYLEQVYADGANMGVEFHANPNEQRRAA